MNLLFSNHAKARKEERLTSVSEERIIEDIKKFFFMRRETSNPNVCMVYGLLAAYPIDMIKNLIITIKYNN